MAELKSQTSEASSSSHARKEGKRTKLATSHKISHEDIQMIGGEWKFHKKPAFIEERSAYFHELFTA
jgi:hypothetical protein